MMLLTTSGSVKAQDVALKTNLLGWATTSLNAGIEIGTGVCYAQSMDILRKQESAHMEC